MPKIFKPTETTGYVDDKITGTADASGGWSSTSINGLTVYYLDTTIASVDTSLTVPFVMEQLQSSSSGSGGAYSWAAELTSSTNLRIWKASVNPGTSADADYQLMIFKPGTVNVQTAKHADTITTGTANHDVTISAVSNLNRTYIFPSTHSENWPIAGGQNTYALRSELTSTTNLRFASQSSAGGNAVWISHVVEFLGT